MDMSKLHPTTHILIFLFLSIMLWKSVLLTVIVSLILIFLVYASRIGFNKLYKHVVGIMWIILVFFFVSLITTGNFAYSLLLSYRLLLLIVIISMLFLSRSYFDIAYGLGILFKPLKYIGFPVMEFVFVLTMALRFIPIMAEEVERIIMSQKTRGFDIKNIKHVLFIGHSILIPVFLSALVRAESMAISLYLRGIDLKNGIPPVGKIRFGLLDILIILFSVLVIVYA